MSSLTIAQLDSIANDEDELEFCPADSVIADMRFAQLLNADREIQVGQTVYKYMPNGVAYTDEAHAAELKTIEPITSCIQVTPENEGMAMSISSNVDFRIANYQLVTFEERVVDGGGGGSGGSAGGSTGGSTGGSSGSNGGGTTGTSTSSGISLSNGVTIPLSDIREVDYCDKNDGDGNWLHRTWTGIWGRNIVAINKFSKNRKLTMNFYDQNYIIYANIGTKLKMQKKLFGIWWNIKAEEMVQGWETVTVKYDIPQPIEPNTFTHPDMKNPTAATYHPFPFSNEKVLIFKIPFVNYDFTTKDLNKAFKIASEKAFEAASPWAKQQGKSANKIGLTCFNDREAYIIHGPFSEGVKNKKSMESKFHAKWFPGNCEFSFSVGSTFKLKNIKFSRNDGVELYRGRVYGAIKYKGKWLAARITKDRDE